MPQKKGGKTFRAVKKRNPNASKLELKVRTKNIKARRAGKPAVRNTDLNFRKTGTPASRVRAKLGSSPSRVTRGTPKRGSARVASPVLSTKQRAKRNTRDLKAGKPAAKKLAKSVANKPARISGAPTRKKRAV